MIYNFVRKTFSRALTSLNAQPYGELIYTQSLTTQSEFPKVPTYRVIDLQGNLLDSKTKYDTA